MRSTALALWLALSALCAGPAFAQVLPSLPNLQQSLPGLPSLPIDEAKSAAAETGDRAADKLRQARRDAAQLLERTHRDVIDDDRHGDPVVRYEVLALSPSPQALANALAAGFTLEHQETLGDLGLAIAVLRAPARLSTRAALDRLRELDPNGVYDFNHLYFGSGDSAAESAKPAKPEPRDAAEARIGLIDGAVDITHPAFARARIVAKSFAGAAPPSQHGTEVASLLIGRDGAFVGAAPGAHLFAADVFGAGPTGGAAAQIVEGFAWLAQQNVSTINASIVGPANKTLEAVVRAVLAKGVAIVAAVGNDGPAAAPLYPASYPGVIGVTGVDAKRRPLIEAARGPQVYFAAPGADIAAAIPGGGYASVRGTSFAAPIVAGLLATQSREALAASALDLGRKGRDDVYGVGFVGAGVAAANPGALAAR